MPTSLYLGDPDKPQTYRQVAVLNGILNNGTVTSEIAGLPGGLAAFDTLNGFFALAYGETRTDSIVAVGLLGPNQPSGRVESIRLYNPDSSLGAVLALTQYRSGAWKPNLTTYALPGEDNFYLNLQSGPVVNRASDATTLGVCPLALRANKTYTSGQLSFGPRVWTGDSLLTGNYHLRIDNDTTGFVANNLPKADVGGNRVVGSPIWINLAADPSALYPNYTGRVSVVSRADGHCLVRVVMPLSNQGTQYEVHLYNEPFVLGAPPSLVTPATTLGYVFGTSLQAQADFEPVNLTTQQPYLFNQFTTGKSISIFDDGEPTRVCGGNIP
jgi:hypothetical protein